MRRDSMRTGVAVAVSLVVHGAPLAAILLASSLLRSPIEVELKPYHPISARLGETRRPPPPSTIQPKPAVATHAHPRPHPRSKPGPAKAPPPAPPPPAPPPAPPATANLAGTGPADARLVVILRTDRLRASPYRPDVQALLEALPDYRTLLDGTGMTPIANLDALLIATSNPYEITATFLAARHADDPKLHAALQKRVLPSWDPRVIRFVSPRLSILARPEDLAALDGDTPDAGTSDMGTPPSWTKELATFDKVTDEPGAPALLVTIGRLDELVVLDKGELPTPRSLDLAMTAEESPSVRVRLGFADEAEAARFVDGWATVLGRWRRMTLFLGLSTMLDPLVVRRDGASVELAGKLAPQNVRSALGFARAMLPPAPPPSLPTDMAHPVDAGAPDHL